MKIEKIFFFEPETEGAHVYKKVELPRGAGVLQASLEQAGYEVEHFRGDVDKYAYKIGNGVLYCISSLTSTFNKARKLALELQARGVSPENILMGGPHSTFCPEEALECCNYVLRGEADETIIPFMRAWEAGQGFEEISGLSHRKDGKIFHNPATRFVMDLDKLPIPDFSRITGKKSEDITPIMTSRGCPYDCSFCSVTGMFGQKYRFRSEDKIIEELRRCKTPFVFFIDDNFAADIKRTISLLKRIKEERIKITWAAQVRVNVAQYPELLRLMYETGCLTLCIGFESINPETLKAYNKKQTLEDIVKAIKMIHKYRVGIHGMFVFGCDHDTEETLAKTLGFTKKMKLETVQFLILTPLPGTKQHKELKEQGRIVDQDYDRYNAHYVVFKPESMSRYRLQDLTMGSMLKFYSPVRTIGRFALSLARPWRIKSELRILGLRFYALKMIKTWLKENEEYIEELKREEELEEEKKNSGS